MAQNITYNDIKAAVQGLDPASAVEVAQIAQLAVKKAGVEGKNFDGSSLAGQAVVAVVDPSASDPNAAFDAADAAAVAAGGGTIYVKAGSYTLTRSMPTLKSGVRWLAGLPQPGGEVGIVADKGVRLIAATRYAYDCFTDGRDDAGAPGTGQPDCIMGAQVSGFYIEGFRFGVKSGALYRFGLFASEVSDNVINDCSKWGIWLENFFHTPCNTNRVNHCREGQIAAVASAHYNTGNSEWHSLNANTNGTSRTSRGIVFFCRGDVSAAGSLNDMYATKIASVCESSVTPDSATATPAGVGSTLLGLSAGDIAKLYVHAPISFSASANGITASRCYFVRSIDTTVNQITMSDKPDGGFAASVALTFSGITAMTMKIGGAPNIEIYGSPMAEIQPSSWHGLDLENGGSLRVLVYKATQITINPHICQNGVLTDFVVREATPTINSMNNGMRIDFDVASKGLQRYGRWASRNSSGGQSSANCGFGYFSTGDLAGATSIRGGAQGAMNLSLSGTLPNVYEPSRGLGVGLTGTLQLWHNQVNSGGDPKGGGLATMMSNGGTLTVAASSDSGLPYNVGETVFVSNPQATACTLQSADALRFVANGSTAATHTLPPNSSVVMILQKDGAGIYWAIYGAGPRGGTAVLSGTAVQTVFNVPHGLATTPSKISVTPGSATAAMMLYATADATNIVVTYLTAPASGTNNITLFWTAAP